MVKTSFTFKLPYIGSIEISLKKIVEYILYSILAFYLVMLVNKYVLSRIGIKIPYPPA